MPVWKLYTVTQLLSELMNVEYLMRKIWIPTSVVLVRVESEANAPDFLLEKLARFCDG